MRGSRLWLLAPRQPPPRRPAKSKTSAALMRADFAMVTSHRRLRRFAVRGVFWRRYLDWAMINVPFYFQPMLLFFWTNFFFFFAAPARRAIISNLKVVQPGSWPA